MFKIKNYKKFNFCWVNIGLAFFVFILSIDSRAHEMWLEPIHYSIKHGEGLLINEKVGQNFKGNKYAYLDSSFKYIKITIGENTINVKSRIGDLPAIQEKTKQEGLHVVTAETTPSEISYGNPDKFTQFLKEDGLQWVLEAHKKRGLPERGFKEIYHRNPKTLIKVGHGKGQDKAQGMPFEWVVKNNPYTSKGTIRAQLFWQGKPAPNMHVNVFNKPKHKSPDSELIKTSYKTDAEGVVEIPRAQGGLFLINSVKMIQPNEKTERKTKAVWESFWASLSFEILLNI